MTPADAIEAADGEPAEAARTGAAPAAPAERIDALDLVRGVALLGILIMNIRAFAMVLPAYGNPLLWPENPPGDAPSAINVAVYYLTSIVADQRFMTLFSVLFGAGIVLMTDRAEARGARPVRTHYRRMGWLLAFGLVHAYGIWWGDILTTYAIAGMIAVIGRRWPARRLLVIGGLLLVVPVLITLGFHAAIPSMEAEELAEIQAFLSPPAEEIARETNAYLGSYVDNVAFRAETVTEFLTTLLPMFLWRVVGLMLVGMALLRLDVLTGRRPPGLRFGLIAFSAGAVVTGVGGHELLACGFDWRYAMTLGALWNYFGSLLGAAGWLALILHLRATGAWPGLRARLVAVGRTAFSNYILHSLICTTLFYGFGAGWFGSVAPAWQLAVVAAVWVVQLEASVAWLARYRFGPLEWCWRALTYGRAVPMRR